MFDYFKGRVQEIGSEHIVLETNSIGYVIAVSKTNYFTLGDELTLFVEDIFKEEGMFLVGFPSKEEREVFRGLVTVNGIGPKSALRILKECDYQDLKCAIESNNIFFIRSVKGIGAKSSAQILLDLRGYFDLSQNINVNQYEEVQIALRSLGYKVKEINQVLSKMNIPNATNEELIKEALRRLNTYAKNISRK